MDRWLPPAQAAPRLAGRTHRNYAGAGSPGTRLVSAHAAHPAASGRGSTACTLECAGIPGRGGGVVAGVEGTADDRRGDGPPVGSGTVLAIVDAAIHPPAVTAPASGRGSSPNVLPGHGGGRPHGGNRFCSRCREEKRSDNGIRR